jgi:MFS family permease
MLGLTTFLLALNRADSLGWTSPAVIGMLVAAVVILAIFVIIEARVPSPMLDLSLFRSRSFSAATLSAVCNYVCVNLSVFMLPFYLINGRQFDTAQAGLLMTAQPILMAISAPLSGALSDRIGPRLLGTVGMAVLGLGMFCLSQMGPQSPVAVVLLGMAIVGVGTGTFISPNSSALMGSAPRSRQGISAGIMATARSVGQVMGVGFAGAVLAAFTGNQSDVIGAAIFGALHTGALLSVGVAAVGVVASAVRGPRQAATSGG